MATFPARLDAGVPYPLGASWDGLGTNFAVFSTAAEKIELCLFDAAGKREMQRFTLPCFDGEVWHGYLPDAAPGLVYGYRAYGPYDPKNGLRFNEHKLLLDPYTKQLKGRLRWTDAVFGYRIRSPHSDLSFDRRDSAPAMVKGVVTGGSFNWQFHPVIAINPASGTGQTCRARAIGNHFAFTAARRYGRRIDARACIPAGPPSG